MYWYGLALGERDMNLIQKKNFFFNRYPGLDLLAQKKIFCTVV
jgi:hypothetical protein